MTTQILNNLENITVEWRIAGWAENVLVVLIGLSLAGLASWLVLTAIKEVLDRAVRLEEKRAKNAEKALDEWVETFRQEHALRIAAEQKVEQERSMRQQLAKGANNGTQKTT